MIEPPESSSTVSLNFWSVIPTIVSNGLTSAYTSVIASAVASTVLPAAAESVVVVLSAGA